MVNLKVKLPGLEMKIQLFQHQELLDLDMNLQDFMILMF